MEKSPDAMFLCGRSHCTTAESFRAIQHQFCFNYWILIIGFQLLNFNYWIYRFSDAFESRAVQRLSLQR